MELIDITARKNEIENVLGDDFMGPTNSAVYCLNTGDAISLGVRGNADEALISVASILGWLFYKTNTTDIKPFMRYFYEEVAKAMVKFAADELEEEKPGSDPMEKTEG